MAYEHRFYIIKPSISTPGDCGLHYASVIAMFNIGYVDGLENRVKAYPYSRYFVYDSEGEEEIAEDRYGDRLIEVPILELIHELESIDLPNASVRALISALRVYRWQPGSLTTLHYGY